MTKTSNYYLYYGILSCCLILAAAFRIYQGSSSSERQTAIAKQESEKLSLTIRYQAAAQQLAMQQSLTDAQQSAQTSELVPIKKVTYLHTSSSVASR